MEEQEERIEKLKEKYRLSNSGDFKKRWTFVFQLMSKKLLGHYNIAYLARWLGVSLSTSRRLVHGVYESQPRKETIYKVLDFLKAKKVPEKDIYDYIHSAGYKAMGNFVEDQANLIRLMVALSLLSEEE